MPSLLKHRATSFHSTLSATTRRGSSITAVQKVLDNRRRICLSGIGLDVCKSRPAETAKHEMDISIKKWGNARMYHDVRSGCMAGSPNSLVSASSRVNGKTLGVVARRR